MTTDKLDEVWDLYDHDMQIVGRAHRRDVLPPNTYHLAVGCIVFDEQGRVLMQQRSSQKLTHPGLWELGAGGSALRGETGMQAAQRELREEMQLTAQLTTANRFSREWFSTWIEEWYAVQLPFALADVHMQASEVAQIKLVPITAARKLLESAGIDQQPRRLDAAATKLGIEP
jgi:isopentenyldiphosphate isomerase